MPPKVRKKTKKRIGGLAGERYEDPIFATSKQIYVNCIEKPQKAKKMADIIRVSTLELRQARENLMALQNEQKRFNDYKQRAQNELKQFKIQIEQVNENSKQLSDFTLALYEFARFVKQKPKPSSEEVAQQRENLKVLYLAIAKQLTIEQNNATSDLLRFGFT
jgi:hypothetical protein